MTSTRLVMSEEELQRLKRAGPEAKKLGHEVRWLRTQVKDLRKVVLDYMTVEGQCVEEHHHSGNCPAMVRVPKTRLVFDTGKSATQGTPVAVKKEDP